jgi:hypothetical protein
VVYLFIFVKSLIRLGVLEFRFCSLTFPHVTLYFHTVTRSIIDVQTIFYTSYVNMSYISVLNFTSLAPVACYHQIESKRQFCHGHHFVFSYFRDNCLSKSCIFLSICYA